MKIRDILSFNIQKNSRNENKLTIIFVGDNSNIYKISGYVENINPIIARMSSQVSASYYDKVFCHLTFEQKEEISLKTIFVEKDRKFFTIENVIDKIINFLEKEGD